MSSAVLHWVLYPTKRKWHAWRTGEKECICGTLTVAHLKEHALSGVVNELSDEQVPCGSCRRILERGNSPASAWIGFIRRHIKHQHCAMPAQDDLDAVAELLIETGPPDDPAAVELFEQIKTLLLTPMRFKTETGRERRRIVGLKESLALLAPRSGSLAAVAAIFRCWRTVMGRQDPGHFRADRVIEGMLQVPEPEAYLQYCKTNGLEPLGVAFHPNVLARAKREPALRGMFGGSGEYWKSTAGQLNIVTD